MLLELRQLKIQPGQQLLGFFRDFSLVAQSLDKPALTGFFILKCVSPDSDIAVGEKVGEAFAETLRVRG